MCGSNFYEWQFECSVHIFRGPCLGPGFHSQILQKKRAKSGPTFKNLELNGAATNFHTFCRPCAMLKVKLKSDQVKGRLRISPTFSFLAKSVVISAGSLDVFSELPDEIWDYIIALLPCPSIGLKCLSCLVPGPSRDFPGPNHFLFLPFMHFFDILLLLHFYHYVDALCKAWALLMMYS